MSAWLTCRMPSTLICLNGTRTPNASWISNGQLVGGVDAVDVE
jgi:hypothetical protein